MTKEETVPCTWCGKPTTMLGTKLCDRCWELETRIHHDPKLAKRMLTAIQRNEAEKCYAKGAQI